MRLLDVVGRVESSGNQFAIRREPSLFLSRPVWLFGEQDANLKLIAQFNPAIAPHSVETVCCTSWGLYQLLGGNLYGMADHADVKNGLMVPLLDYLCDTTLQDEYALRFMASMGFDGGQNYAALSGADKYRFARHWNGPGNPPAYVIAMDKAFRGG